MNDAAHPLGADWATRVEFWRMLALHGDPGPLARVAAAIVEAADVTDPDALRAAVLEAVGLHGNRASARGLQALRFGLDDLHKAHRAAQPADPADAPDPTDLERLRAAGISRWLYLQATGNDYGDRRTHRQFLRRLAAPDAEASAVLEWAFRIEGKATTEAAARGGSRGRVR